MVTVGTVGTTRKQGPSALPLLFEQWEQWEQNSGKTAFFAHFRANKPATIPIARAPSAEIGKDLDAPFGAFPDFSARRGFVPRPLTGGTACQCLAHVCKGPCTRQHARAWQVVDALHVQGEQCGGDAVAVGHAQAGQTLLAVKGPARARQQSPMLQQNTGNRLVVKALAHLGPEHLGQ